METDIEAWARQKIFAAGGRMYKWTTPSRRGTPDDIVLWPGKIIHFIEFKWDVNEPDPMQLIFHDELRAFGFEVLIVRDRDWIRDYIKCYAPKR